MGPVQTARGDSAQKKRRAANYTLLATLAAAVLSVGASTCQIGNAGRTPAINNTCLSCHDGRNAPDASDFAKGPHRFISCETCHGPGDAHIRNAGRGGLFIDNPGRAPFAVQHQLCGQCHANETQGFLASAHFTESAATCNDCHNVHKPLALPVASGLPNRLDNPGFAQLCGKCHETQVADFALSGHARLNVATCGSCHNPHVESLFTRNPITNELCLQCHGSFNLGFDREETIDAHTGIFHPVDPAGTGSSRCTTCHLPPLDALNQDRGPHDHTLFTIPPAFTNDAIALGISPAPPNSCSGIMGCHDAAIPNSGMPFDVNDTDNNDALQLLYEMIGEVPERVR